MSTYVNLKLNVHLLNVFTKVVSTKVILLRFNLHGQCVTL